MATRRLVIELEESALPRGRVLDVDGEHIAFVGWVELAAALERARPPLADAGDRSDTHGGRSTLRGTSGRE
ncbi:MAG TPA: hypothetical protein VH391_09870 [Solirubrobacterales bacterium]